MQCYSGIWLNLEKRFVPCGQCLACRINKARKWSSRILQENLTHFKETGYLGTFLTFTYNEKYVPAELSIDATRVLTLKKERWLRWIKRRRTECDFRYYTVGEYGDKFGRPHYHMALFPYDGKTSERLQTLWSKYGFTCEDELNDERARYLANYCTKKLTSPDDQRLEYNQEPEFRTSSRNPPIGHGFVDYVARSYQTGTGKQVLAKHGDIGRTFRHQGRSYPLSPYVLEKVREKLSIPALHCERAAHPHYLKIYPTMEAESCRKKAEAQETLGHAKIKQKLYRTTSQKL